MHAVMGSADRILIVDDDPIFREIAKEALASAFADVRVAEDGEDALRQLQARAADVVLTDINMPNRDGIELIRDIRNSWPACRIIAISGGTRMAGPDLFLQLAGALGAHQVLSKPVSAVALVAAVRGAPSSVQAG